MKAGALETVTSVFCADVKLANDAFVSGTNLDRLHVVYVGGLVKIRQENACSVKYNSSMNLLNAFQCL